MFAWVAPTGPFEINSTAVQKSNSFQIGDSIAIILDIINNTTMSQQRLGDAFDPVVDFGERKLRVLITDKKFDEAIEAIIVRSSMMADRLTLEIKRTAVNHTTNIWDNVTTLMIAARDGAPLALVASPTTL